MQQLWQQLKYLYQNGSMTVRLVMVNVGVFVLIQLFSAFERLSVVDPSTSGFSQDWMHFIFALPVEPISVLLQPYVFVLCGQYL
ncbi:MAG: hypothetical protein RL078_749 [Bacteroidota bacterium]